MLTIPKHVVIDWTKQKGNTAKAGGSTARLIRTNSQRSTPLGKVLGQLDHWSAADYLAFFDSYHYGVGLDRVGGNVIVARMLTPQEKGQHAWGENSGYLGFDFCAMQDATSTYDGPFPITNEMMVMMAVLKAESFCWTQVDPRGTHQAREMKCNRAKTAIAPTGRLITRPNNADHALVSRQAGYFPDRWDIGKRKAPLDLMVLEHYDDLKAGRVQFLFKPLLVA